MPGGLPSLTALQVIRALKRCGFMQVRQKSSHVVLHNASTGRRVVVPKHAGKDIKKPLLKKIIEIEAQMSVSEFLKLL